MNMHALSALIPLFMLASSAFAAECRDEPGNVDIKCLQAQSEREIADADKELNAAYGILIESIDDASAKTDLIRAQRAWLTYYQLDCKVRYDLMHVGSAFTKSEVFDSCRLDKLKRRVAELKEHCGDSLDCRGR